MANEIANQFELASAVWNGDKFLLEGATASGSKQMKVTAEVVRAYLQGIGGDGEDRRVLSFKGFANDAEVSMNSTTGGLLGVDVWFAKSVGRFAVATRSLSVGGAGSSGEPSQLFDNWSQRAIYNDGNVPRAGNLFVCQADDKPYWWTGSELRPIVTDTSGEVIGESIPLTEIDEIIKAETSTQAAGKKGKAVVKVAQLAQNAKKVNTEKPTAVQIENLTLKRAIVTDATKRSARIVIVG